MGICCSRGKYEPKIYLVFHLANLAWLCGEFMNYILVLKCIFQVSSGPAKVEISKVDLDLCLSMCEEANSFVRKFEASALI